MTAPTKIVKLQPYPFSARVVKSEGVPAVNCQILKLTDVGFLLKVNQTDFFKVGDNHQVEFDIPASEHTVSTPVKVIKTYDMAADKTDKNEKKLDKMYTVEMHFRKLADKSRAQILEFIKKIGQK